MAVGCTRAGLLPISTFANDLGKVAYHDFAHAAGPHSEEVCARLVTDLGPTSRVMLLRNHGDITVGRTAGEAFFLMDNLHKAYDVQVDAMAALGSDSGGLLQPSAAALAENAQVINVRGGPCPATARLNSRGASRTTTRGSRSERLSGLRLNGGCTSGMVSATRRAPRVGLMAETG